VLAGERSPAVRSIDLALYRPNVGVVLFNRDGLVWYGQRHATPGPHNWQFPQGAWTRARIC
jgi:8-oxo-dGTP pyrophosphatase MutT (NUDIX family)